MPIEVVQDAVDTDRSAGDLGESGDLTDVLVGPVQVDPGWHSHGVRLPSPL